MRYNLSQFTLQGDTYSEEASTLRVEPVYGRITSGNPGIVVTDDAGKQLEFALAWTDTDASGEDVYGWNFRPTMGTVQKDPQMANRRILIIND